MSASRSAGGFTLMELVVVIGLVGVLAGLAGLAAPRSSSAASVRTAASLVASLLDRAARESASTGRRVTLVTDTDPDSDGFLQVCWLAAEDGEAPGHWVSLDSSQVLQRDVRLVPVEVPGCVWSDGSAIVAGEGTKLEPLSEGEFDDPTVRINGTLARVGFSFVNGRPVSEGTPALVVIGPVMPKQPRLEYARPQATCCLGVSDYGVTFSLPGGTAISAP